MSDQQPTNYMAELGQTLISNGYAVLPIRPIAKTPGKYTNGEWEGYFGWQKHCERQTTEHEYNVWRNWPGCAIGLACGSVIGIDIDVMDEAVAFEVEKLAREMLGDTDAKRVGREPKRALFYRAEVPFKGKKLHPLECYGLDSQMVIYGIHPVTNRPYYWGDEGLHELDISRLPVITEAQAMNWLHTAYARVPEALRLNKASTFSGETCADRKSSDPRGTYEAVKSALEYIPNAEVDGSSWVAMLNAIKAALGEEGRSLWLDWSHSSSKSGASGKRDTAERRWETAKPKNIGAGTIYHQAEQNGWIPDADLTLNAAKAEAVATVEVNVQEMVANSNRKKEMAKPALEPEVAERLHPVQPVATVDGLPAIVMNGLRGYFRDFVDFATATSRRPQPIIALGAAISAVGAASGRRYQTISGLRTNTYFLVLALSGGGKENPRAILTAAFDDAGLSHYNGPSKIASSASIPTSLHHYPVKLYALDEVGQIFGINGSRNAGTHKLEILPVFTELYSKAGTKWGGTSYGNSSLLPQVPIINPHIVFFGVTAPDVMMKALRGGNLSDGSLARFLMLQPEAHYVESQEITVQSIPSSLIEPLRVMAGFPAVQEDGNLPVIVASFDTAYQAADPNLRTVPQTEEATRMLRDVDKEEDRILARPGLDQIREGAFWARLAEHVKRLSLISAISTDPVNTEITAFDVKWAYALVRYSIRTVVQMARDNIADTHEDGDAQKLFRFMKANREAPMQCTGTQLHRLFRTQKHAAEVIKGVIASGEVVELPKVGKLITYELLPDPIEG